MKTFTFYIQLHTNLPDMQIYIGSTEQVSVLSYSLGIIVLLG